MNVGEQIMIREQEKLCSVAHMLHLTHDHYDVKQEKHQACPRSWQNASFGDVATMAQTGSKKHPNHTVGCVDSNTRGGVEVIIVQQKKLLLRELNSRDCGKSRSWCQV